MPDVQKLARQKEEIITIIKNKGPSFPARISRETKIPPLFVAAFMSELTSERKLKLSNMKVGSSPLYYIEGQESSLEDFIEHLPQKEREAFHLLKDRKILEDSTQLPAIRVALRSLKDFALPVNVRADGESKLYWKLHTIPPSETKQILEEKLLKKSPPLSQPVEEKKEETPTQAKEPILLKKDTTLLKNPKHKPKRPLQHQFPTKVKEILGAKDFEVLEILAEKKKEFSAKIRTDTDLGKQEYFLVAKEKKKVTENDLSLALQKAQTEKMPALIISTGDLDKKAKSHLLEWRNLVKFEKI